MGVAGRSLAALGLAALVVVGCGGGGGDDGLGPPAPPTPPTPPPAPAAAPAGSGVVVVGSTTSGFALTECRTEADPAGVAAAHSLVAVAGEGTTADGVAFTVEVARFATGDDDVRTFTDTVTYTDPARILQAQRIEVAGQITDLRHEDAAGPMLRVRPGGVAVRGLAGPPGSVAGDDGITGIAVDATC